MNNTTTDALDAMFDVAPSEATDTAIVVPEIEVLSPVDASTTELSEAEQQAQEDYVFSRAAIKSVAVESQTTLHRAIEVAQQTDTPRAFEVAALLVRSTLDAHRELQALHKSAAEIRAVVATAKTPPGTVNIQQGVVFSGTSDELLRLISKDRQ